MTQTFSISSPNLQGLPLFRNVDMAAIGDLLSGCRQLVLAPGELLLEPDQVNHQVFIVLEGNLAVHLKRLDSPCLTILEAGECVGELSILDQEHTSAYVIASTASRILVIEEAIIWQLIARSSEVARNLLYVLCRRIRQSNIALMQTEHEASYDPLTGLPNRRGMEYSFGRQLQRSHRDGTPLSVMMADVDYFKRVNDEHGHIIGDRVLRLIARRLLDGIRPTDMVARYGGEEFAVMLPDTSLESASRIAERIRVEMAETPLVIDDPALVLPVTLSFGLAVSAKTDSLYGLLGRADQHLYRAKQLGRNRIHHGGMV